MSVRDAEAQGRTTRADACFRFAARGGGLCAALVLSGCANASKPLNPFQAGGTVGVWTFVAALLIGLLVVALSS